MKVFVIGVDERLEEFKSRLPEGVDADFFPVEIDLDEIDLEQYDVLFDLNLDDEPEKLALYSHLDSKPVIVSAVKVQLTEMVYYLQEPNSCFLFGMNALPTFINRPLMEFSSFNEEDNAVLDKICSHLGWQYKIVQDRVGMITPRVICMIINEAFYTLQEGTASEKDIDESMKLGTNYPYGPFEWCERIGIHEVYEVLDAISQDTRDERYKICPLLKTRYLKG